MVSSRPAGEKGVGKSGKPLHFKGSSFHRVITDVGVLGAPLCGSEAAAAAWGDSMVRTAHSRLSSSSSDAIWPAIAAPSAAMLFSQHSSAVHVLLHIHAGLDAW